MKGVLSFLQILIAVILGSLVSDVIKEFADQCVARDKKGCAETRLECIWNSRKLPNIIPFCFIEKEL